MYSGISFIENLGYSLLHFTKLSYLILSTTKKALENLLLCLNMNTETSINHVCQCYTCCITSDAKARTFNQIRNCCNRCYMHEQDFHFNHIANERETF